jgi:transposase
VAQNFLPCDRDQELLLPPSLREWLPEDHLAWFVLDAVGQLDLELFYAAYRRDGWGAAAHEPRMMVSLLVYAYSIGVRSARGIERRCREDVAFRLITANQVPDHATIARFLARHEQAIGELFSGVLELCAEAGLVRVGVVAVDGTKIEANASHRAVRSYTQIVEEILAEAVETDAREDELFGEARGDELPVELSTTGERRARLLEAKRRLDQKRAAEAKPVPRDRCARLRECKRRLEEDLEVERATIVEHEAWLERGIASDGSRRMVGARARVKRYPLPEKPVGAINVTDPDARKIRSSFHALTGYNAQAVVGEGQIVIAAEVTVETSDFSQLEPMITKARAELAAVGIEDIPEVVVADAGYWQKQGIQDLVNQGMQTLVPPDAHKRKGPRPGRRGGIYDFMRRVLATDHATALYKKRQALVEPVFAQTKWNRRAGRFQRRGRASAQSEWRLLTATHNLMKLHKHQLATA